MTRRTVDVIETGIPGLDEILNGGVVRKNNILVEGGPGTGKTTLGLAFAYFGAKTLGERTLIVSFELSDDKLLRDARGFNWDLEQCIAEESIKIIETTPAVLLEELRNEDSVLAQEVNSFGATRLLIDGLTPLQLYADAHEIPFRESVHFIIDGLTRLGVTTLVTRETSRKPELEHERYVFDTIISLQHHEQALEGRRTLSVVKSRGQDFVGGVHTMTIEPEVGIRIYRRAQSREVSRKAQPTSTERISTGCDELDRIVGGGLYKGSISMVAGISGTGKTVAGTQFLVHNARQGRRGLLVSLDEHPAQLIRNAATLGFDLQGMVERREVFIHFESPLELQRDIHFDRITRLVEEQDIECVVCDSIAVYEHAEPETASDFMYSLASFLKARLITAYFNYESPELLGVSHISERLKGSPLVDNIMLLSHVEISTQLRRALVVPKVRGSKNVQVTHEFSIGPGGISIVADEHTDHDVPQLPFSSYYGLLARSPARRSPAVDEAVLQGKDLPRALHGPVTTGEGKARPGGSNDV